MMTLLVLVLLRLLLRSSPVAIGVFFLLVVIPPTLASPHPALDLPLYGIWTGVMLFVVLRVGLVGLIAWNMVDFFTNPIQSLDPGSWVGPASMTFLVLLLAPVVAAAVIAVGRRGLLQDEA